MAFIFAPPGVLSPDTARIRDEAGPSPASMVCLWSLIVRRLMNAGEGIALAN